LNANNLASLSTSQGLTLRFISLGYAQTSTEGALIRLKDKAAGYLVLMEGELPLDIPPFLNRANAGIREAVERGILPAERLSKISLTPGLTAALYRLRR
jgi:hypothetical protein